jgi:hypothetical protein
MHVNVWSKRANSRFVKKKNNSANFPCKKSVVGHLGPLEKQIGTQSAVSRASYHATIDY